MKVEITRRAQEDRHRIWMFQADRSVAYADMVRERFRRHVSLLGSMPFLGRKAGEDERELSVPDIQLVARYRVDGDAVRILRVWHTRENREKP